MTANVQLKGDYELFETTKGHRILVLNGERWYAWIKGQQSPILVKSDPDHEKDHTLAKGRFYLIDFENEPDFNDIPHLFLEEDGHYRELILPNGLPTDSDAQKRLVEPDEAVDEAKLRKYVQ